MKAPQALIEAALARGGKDNVTVITVQIGDRVQ
jgi:serine/threonine protein phosphatase PrpC